MTDIVEQLRRLGPVPIPRNLDVPCDITLEAAAEIERLRRVEAHFAFVCRVLSIFDGFDALSNDDVWWRTDGDYAPITLFVSCNDLFWWACSDCEKITPENVELLEQTVKDTEKTVGSNMQADRLFACRVRGMRPQGAMYRYLAEALHPLFDACGPVREADTLNPKARP